MELSVKVYKQLSNVPKGKVISYKDLAKLCNTNAVRAVASHVGKNPNAPIVPCHRVVLSDGRVGNYTYKGENRPDRKIKILRSEGVKVINNRVSSDFFWKG